MVFALRPCEIKFTVYAFVILSVNGKVSLVTVESSAFLMCDSTEEYDIHFVLLREPFAAPF